MLRIALLTLVVSVLTACGGGGGGGGGSTPSLGGSENNNKSAAGIWDNQDQGADYLLAALIDERSHAMFYVINAPLMLQCPLTIDGTKFSCEPTPDYSVTGTITEKERLTVTIKYQGNTQYNLEVLYNELSDDKISLSDFYSTWQSILGAYTETITIDNDGYFTGSDTDGCIISGNIDYNSPKVNVQSFLLRYRNCDREGFYYGKGVYIENLNSPSGPAAWRIFASSSEYILDAYYIEQ
ncbi:hypothetical protein ACFOEK_11545 [Litoribrevibacter euphylliae]|uniref:Lipoprotein n=1 Tax=Litoribrevibacter euphylliae TaxID=1834034 RepID=A0ABV7HJH7_9GAMM